MLTLDKWGRDIFWLVYRCAASLGISTTLLVFLSNDIGIVFKYSHLQKRNRAH